ncbi:MAG: macro domain-containing protein [Acidobacteriota bacterium]
MITLMRGNIIETDAEALVNTVNCEGFMGKGIALQFKKAFPTNFEAYRRAAQHGEVQPGRMFIFRTDSLMNPKYIVNFPTKRRWREKSRLEDIKAGLKALRKEVERLEIRSIAIPPLGCGLGGLDWAAVRPLIEQTLSGLEKVRVILFEPTGAPPAKAMPIGTRRPEMTLARALFIRLMHQYLGMAYRLTLLEIQKLAYFLQEAGERLRLNYVAHWYGPYAHNLDKVLEKLEGHFTRGYGDTQRPDVEIELLPGAVEEADAFLVGHPAAREHLARVNDVIEGFETPYGMELLSSVHWVGVHSQPPATDAERAVAAVQNWNRRKLAMFKPEHIRLAWQRLQEHGWLPH